MDAKLWIAAGVIGVLLMLLTAALIANGVYQVKVHGFYDIPPAYFIDFCRMALTASLVSLSIGSVAQWRSKTNGKKK